MTNMLTKLVYHIPMALIGGILWAILFKMKVEWNCGLCGKCNITGVFRCLLGMCDHGGNFQ